MIPLSVTKKSPPHEEDSRKRNSLSKLSSFLDNVVWSDETKIELFGRNSVSHVKRQKNALFGQTNIDQNTDSTMKYGGDSIMV